MLFYCQLFGDISSFLSNLFCGQIFITSIFINLLILMVEYMSSLDDCFMYTLKYTYSEIVRYGVCESVLNQGY